MTRVTYLLPGVGPRTVGAVRRRTRPSPRRPPVRRMEKVRVKWASCRSGSHPWGRGRRTRPETTPSIQAPVRDLADNARMPRDPTASKPSRTLCAPSAPSGLASVPRPRSPCCWRWWAEVSRLAELASGCRPTRHPCLCRRPRAPAGAEGGSRASSKLSPGLVERARDRPALGGARRSWRRRLWISHRQRTRSRPYYRS